MPFPGRQQEKVRPRENEKAQEKTRNLLLNQESLHRPKKHLTRCDGSHRLYIRAAKNGKEKSEEGDLPDVWVRVVKP